MARLDADEDMPLPVVVRLREMGHDVVTVAQMRRCGKSDQEVLDATNDVW